MSLSKWVSALACLAMLTGCGSGEDLTSSSDAVGQGMPWVQALSVDSEVGIPTSETRSGSLTLNYGLHYGPFTVVAGTQFKVVLTGTGNADLYVRFGVAPTATEYDCRPYKVTATETCDLLVPAGTTMAYVMVRENGGSSPAAFDLAISYTKPFPDQGMGIRTSETRSGSLASGANANYGPFTVVGGTQFKVTMTGMGDPDLYVQFGAAPTPAQYACRPYSGTAAETCDLTVPVDTTRAYIMVRGASASTFNLAIRSMRPGFPDAGPPMMEVREGSLTSGANANHGPFSVAAGTRFKVTLNGTGDADLYVRLGAAPTPTQYDCRSNNVSGPEFCDVAVPADTTAYVMVRGFTDATFELVIRYTVPYVEPLSGIPASQTRVGSVTWNADANYGPIPVVAGTRFKVAMTGTGDPDLYVRFGAAPTPTQYHCRPNIGNTATETCDLMVPSDTTTAYVTVKSSLSATFNLLITYYTQPEPQSETPTTSATPVSETRVGSLTSGANANHGPFSVVAGTQFKVAMTGTGDPDLYVRFGAAPTSTQYDCRPYSETAVETCDLTVPTGTTTAYVMVSGYSASTFNLAIDYTKP